jgi:RNA polymerase sigma-70 factor, ECF subfamily
VQPYPDALLDEMAAGQPDPEAVAVSRETMSLAFLATIQLPLIAVLGPDVRLAISPQVGEWNGQQEVGDALREGMNALGRWRVVPIMANGQPGAAGYLRRPGQTAFFPFVLSVLRIEHGRLVDIAAFEQPSMFARFGLPASATNPGPRRPVITGRRPVLTSRPRPGSGRRGTGRGRTPAAGRPGRKRCARPA